jgi:hypothetical protein
VGLYCYFYNDFTINAPLLILHTTRDRCLYPLSSTCVLYLDAFALECCSVNPGGGYEVPPTKFLDRILGYDSGDVVVINFKVRYLDENGSLKTGEKRFDNYLENCGKPR